MISYEQFKTVEMQVGEIVGAEKVPDTDKLLKLSVNFNEPTLRQIISGIATHFPEPQSLVGKKCAFVTNLEPRVIRGLESQGMIMGVGGSDPSADGPFSLLEASSDALPGSPVK